MSEPWKLLLAWMAGGGLGVLFFGGLWWTVRKALSGEQPALWIFGSLLLRTGGVLVGFYFVSGSRWDRLLLCFLGFVLARFLVTRMTKPSGETEPHQKREASGAP